MNTPTIDRLFFDVDDTLYSTSDFARQARKNSIQALVDIGVDVEPEVMYNELQEVIREFSSNYPYHYDKLLLRLPDEALEGINSAIAVAAAVYAYHKTKHERLEPYPGVHPFFTSLENSSIPKAPGIITEGLSVKQAEKILRLNVYDYLDPEAIFISDKVGISKPNPKLFQTALRESSTDTERSIYVGDHPEKDMDPANSIGMVTVQMDRGTKHSQKEGQTEPDFVISTFRELTEVLSEEFNVSIPDVEDPDS